MADPIQFYFDFSSPYSYIASEQIEAIVERHDRRVEYRPVLLGAVFKVAGGAPLTELYGPKARYALRDFSRSARHANVPYSQPGRFPTGSLHAKRAVVWLQQHRPEAVAPFVHAVYRAYFVQGQDISGTEVVEAAAGPAGVDAAELQAGVQQPDTKERLKTQVEQAIAAGVFGAPTIVVDGELFWGHDRLPQIDRWLAQGPF